MNQQIVDIKKELLSKFENGKSVVLSTSFNDVVTSRSVTVISFNGYLYFTSVQRQGAVKNKQIEQNPNVAICLNTMQITGNTTTIVGLK